MAIINGILLLNKPLGLSSNVALQKARRLLDAKKAGHAGSLDPLATGMLPLCFGEATKFCHYLLASDKVYEVEACLGAVTASGDKESPVVQQRPVSVTPSQLTQVLQAFIGEIEQIPPMFSALKYQGKPLYAYAREGIELERQARRVHIYALDLLSPLSDNTFRFRVHCSKGTYIRSLVMDVGEALGCGAHVSALHRVWVAPYQNYPMVTLDQCVLSDLLPVDSAVMTLSRITLDEQQTDALIKGQPVRCLGGPGQVRFYDVLGQFLGVGQLGVSGEVEKRRLKANVIDEMLVHTCH